MPGSPRWWGTKKITAWPPRAHSPGKDGNAKENKWYQSVKRSSPGTMAQWVKSQCDGQSERDDHFQSEKVAATGEVPPEASTERVSDGRFPWGMAGARPAGTEAVPVSVWGPSSDRLEDREVIHFHALQTRDIGTGSIGIMAFCSLSEQQTTVCSSVHRAGL